MLICCDLLSAEPVGCVNGPTALFLTCCDLPSKSQPTEPVGCVNGPVPYSHYSFFSFLFFLFPFLSFVFTPLADAQDLLEAAAHSA